MQVKTLLGMSQKFLLLCQLLRIFKRNHRVNHLVSFYISLEKRKNAISLQHQYDRSLINFAR